MLSLRRSCPAFAGGHAAALLGKHPEVQQFWGLDVDPEAHEIAQTKLQSAKEKHSWNCSLSFSQCNYSDIKKAIGKQDVDATVDAILLDLGVSSMQV